MRLAERATGRSASWAGLVAASALLVACGSPDDASGGPEQTSPTPSPSASEPSSESPSGDAGLPLAPPGDVCDRPMLRRKLDRLVGEGLDLAPGEPVAGADRRKLVRIAGMVRDCNNVTLRLSGAAAADVRQTLRSAGVPMNTMQVAGPGDGPSDITLR